MSKRVAFKTLGCRLNQFETDSLVTDFHRAGYEIVKFNDKADVYVVNTCTVTNQSDQKSKNVINQAVRSSDNDSLVVVTGCMVDSQKAYLESRDDLTYVVDNRRKSSVLPLVEAHFRGEIVHPSDLQQDLFNFSVVEKGFHTRSTIKIQDGCNNFCTYCIVPAVRGHAISRPVDEIIAHAEKTIALGNKEIVLTGVNISRYKHSGVKFENLVEKIISLPGDFRVRISSIEPDGFTDRFPDLFENPKLCPHLHLCLQSGSDKVLMRMRRFYSIDQYLKLIDQFRNRYPDFNFTTDVIVGFPGETEEEFRETVDIVKKVGFSHVHTFKYSKRNGTRAERMDDQVPEKVKSERSEIIRTIAEENKLSYRSRFIGKEQTVLIERNTKRGTSKGYGENYIPMEINNGTLQNNTFHRVRIITVADDKDKTALAELI